LKHANTAKIIPDLNLLQIKVNKMKYAVGDLVYIKENAPEIKGCVNFAGPMRTYLATTHKIIKLDASGRNAYKLDGATSGDTLINFDGYWLWAEEWLEPAGSEFEDISEKEMYDLFV